MARMRSLIAVVSEAYSKKFRLTLRVVVGNPGVAIVEHVSSGLCTSDCKQAFRQLTFPRFSRLSNTQPQRSSLDRNYRHTTLGNCQFDLMLEKETSRFSPAQPENLDRNPISRNARFDRFVHHGKHSAVHTDCRDEIRASS